MTAQEISPEVFTADYVGEAGDRIFYLQSRGGAGTFSYLVEKQQVAALAERLRELLVLVDQEDTVGSASPGRDPAMSLDAPIEAEWRVGTMGLAFEEEADRVVLLLQPVSEEEEEPGGEEALEELIEQSENGVRFLLRRDQARAFVLHGLAVVAEGRPLCQLCGLPMDPGGHICPASNGHRPLE
jgi:uncharacterized repeat protein (TIGR03847 family)